MRREKRPAQVPPKWSRASSRAGLQAEAKRTVASALAGQKPPENRAQRRAKAHRERSPEERLLRAILGEPLAKEPKL